MTVYSFYIFDRHSMSPLLSHSLPYALPTPSPPFSSPETLTYSSSRMHLHQEMAPALPSRAPADDPR